MTEISNRRRNFLNRKANARELETSRFQTAIQAVAHKPVFVEDAEGNRVRVWSDCSRDARGKIIPSLDVVEDKDVRAWLLNLRVTTETEALEYVHAKYFRSMVRDGYLRRDEFGGDFYWLTVKAAERWSLPRVMGCKFAPVAGEFGEMAPRKAA